MGAFRGGCGLVLIKLEPLKLSSGDSKDGSVWVGWWQKDQLDCLDMVDDLVRVGDGVRGMSRGGGGG